MTPLALKLPAIISIPSDSNEVIGTYCIDTVLIQNGFRDMCNSQKKIPVGDGDDPRPQLLGHLICLFTLIINIYGVGVGISTIKKFTSGRGWGMTLGPEL